MKLKILRIIFSIFIFILFVFIFFSSNNISIIIENILTSFQIIPSILKFIVNGFTFLGLGFVIIIILTILFGRVYCSFLCPLGIFQDIFIFISGKFKKKFSYIKSYNWIRYSVLGISLFLSIIGFFILLNIVDPYSIFSRTLTNIFKPAFSIVVNNIVSFLKMNKIYLNLFYKIHKINLSLFLFSFISFLIILFLSLIKGRLYCNTICPVGTLLGYISKYSILKISIDQVQCTSCSLCEKVCKASCIDSKNKKVDLSRCISCYNCLDICPQNAIEYKRVTNQTNVDYSRRNFIKYIFPTSLFSIALLGSVIRKPFIALRNNSKIFKKKIISPPGSQSISHFLDSCTACHICVNSCPSKVLKPAGFLGIMQPTLDYSYAFCDYECNICTQVCPSGAIKPFKLEKKKKVQIGKVKLIKEQCIVYKSNLDCGACAEHCPTTAVYTVPYKGMYGPEVNTDYCIGCGACEYACPAVPEKAIIVEGNDIHQMAQERPREKVKEQPEKQLLDEENVEEEFPF